MAKRSMATAPKRAAKPGPRLSESIRAERAAVVCALQPVVKMLGNMLGPNVELVLHDLTALDHSVIGIANGHVTGRSIGNSVLSGPKDDKSFAAVMEEMNVRGQAIHALIEDYSTENSSGQRLRSSSVIFRDSDGEPFAALCLNADMAPFEAAHAWLERILHAKSLTPDPKPSGEPEMDVLMKEIIDDAVHKLGKRVSMMSKEEKIYAVQVMMRRGLFIVKGGVPRAAAALGVTRHTIYNYLEEVKLRQGDLDDAH
ncbi:helix-turn-helix transcriptional regulator [Scleromatobacter humisilvae]|uniref:PAS domain-containing protein n=1 Tax=Scleromatobacter humisilvae TaxID=2897159 RepID=A0A9X1YHV3_9BURK|nr:PAS domain-containing protein [Scleromatobacter humisilvae]MCK9686423.1 PAS domain-containing protein [Scleromatobacter humisilvae]